jgi:hypothetical protein
LGEGSLKGGGTSGGNEEIQRGDQGPCSLAYDEMKHSSDLEDDRASCWRWAPTGKQCAQKSRGRRVVRPITRKGERATRENTRTCRGRTVAGVEQPVRAQGHVGRRRGAGVLVSMPSRREMTSTDATIDDRSTRFERAFALRPA